ncbi:MAG TPA: cysteine desulfurase family protein [Anaerolineales bacterium]|nr:cysteine desulfurase family protein [Anaerolineales bacterium]
MTAARVYLDYAASTPVDERVLERMLPYFGGSFGNPSSIHRFGQEGEAALDEARRMVAEVMVCRPGEIVFTSGGTESDNLALRGAALAAKSARGASHILTTPVEHPAVLNACRYLERHHGFQVEWLSVDSDGRADPDDVARRLRDETAVVSVIYGNNEIGTINPVASIADRCRARGVVFHTDAVQAASQLSVRVDELGADLISIGAHKFYGPKGVGALYCRAGIDLDPLQPGGEQEAGRRAGTENVPLIVGLAAAFEITAAERPRHARRFAALRDRILDGVVDLVPGAGVTGHRHDRLPNHASFVFSGVDANRLLAALDLAGYACSSGSACKTGDPSPSSALLALGLTSDLALGSLRVTVGRRTTDEDIDGFLATLPALVEAQRRTAVSAG